MDYWNYTTTPSTNGWYNYTFPTDFSIPTIPEYTVGPVRPTATQNPLLDNITFAVRVILFIICLMENGIAVFILHKNTRNGRRTFAQYMLISIACVDLTTLIYYSATFVQFSHGRFVWLLPGLAGDALCKLFNFLVNLPGKILVLCLVALACDATRNSSSKGRKEHSKTFSIIVTSLFWITAAGFSAIYLKISKVQTSFQSNECSTDSASQATVLMLNMIHSYVFVATGDLILTILSLVVYIRIRKRKKEMKRQGQKRAEKGKSHAKISRQRKVGVAEKLNVEILDQQFADVGDNEMRPVTSYEETGADDLKIESSEPSEPSMLSPISSEIPIVMSSVEGNESVLGETAVSVINTNRSEVNEGSRRRARRKSQKKQRQRKTYNSTDVEAQGSTSGTRPSAEEERFETTRKEAKIMAAVSLLFAVLSATQLILPLACPSCSVYVLYAVQMAQEIYAVIKPGIYASIDKEFRKRYTQLSPVACCCFRRVPRCHAVQEVRITQ